MKILENIIEGIEVAFIFMVVLGLPIMLYFAIKEDRNKICLKGHYELRNNFTGKQIQLQRIWVCDSLKTISNDN